MKKQKPVLSKSSQDSGALNGLVKRLHLVWLLFWDKRVPIWTKSVVLLASTYVVSPFDIFLPIPIPGLAQLDDLGVILLGVALFVKLSPQDVVQEYIDKLEYGDLYDDEIIDTSYHIVNED